ncbi:MAG TPA: hypothetical protein PK819_12750, partial [Thermomicrobiales bacterium]|nr:hypothetical protein [Thermomicrobiales bacterium]
MHDLADNSLQRLTSKGEFLQFQAAAMAKWTELWSDANTVVTVGIGSSSIAKNAEAVLEAAATYALHSTNITVRQTAVDGADWSEVRVSVKRPGAPVVHYAHVTVDDVQAVIEGNAQDKAIGVDGDQAFQGIPPLSAHPFYKYQHRIVLQDVGIIDPD